MQGLTIPSVYKHVEQTELSYSTGGNIKWFGSFLNIYLLYDADIPFLSTYSGIKNSDIQRLVH